MSIAAIAVYMEQVAASVQHEMRHPQTRHNNATNKSCEKFAKVTEWKTEELKVVLDVLKSKSSR
jgi:hypothetical protein